MKSARDRYSDQVKIEKAVTMCGLQLKTPAGCLEMRKFISLFDIKYLKIAS